MTYSISTLALAAFLSLFVKEDLKRINAGSKILATDQSDDEFKKTTD